MTFPDCIKLPVSFDPQPLVADLAGLGEKAWIAHFNTANYEGDWAAAPLLAPAGETHPVRQISADPTCSQFEPTEFMLQVPHIAAVLDWFECPLKLTRLLRLGPGAMIREHRDYNLGYADGEIRLHVPVTTSPDVEFLLDDNPVRMTAGECWYLNFNLPHSLNNLGDEARIHLVIDCVINDWLDGLLRMGTSSTEFE
jgi:hypothetical protein